MARNVTAGTIRDYARLRVDDAAGELATDPVMLAFIDRAWSRLYSLYVQAEPDRFRTEEEVVTSGSASFNVQTNWLSTIGVDYKRAANDYLELDRLQEGERNLFNGQVTGSFALAYRIIGAAVTLYPTPPTGQTYRHVYLPTAPTISDAATQIDCRLGHEEYLELLVARRLLEKEDQYDGRWEGQIKAIEDELSAEAAMRYLHAPVLMTLPTDCNADPADYRRRSVLW